MKVIAKVSSSKYLCEIEHGELEKFLDLYYNNLKELEVGRVIDLGKGYDWNDKTQRALKKTEEFFKANVETIDAISNAFLYKESK